MYIVTSPAVAEVFSDRRGKRSVILADALATLGDDQRRVVVLRDIEQLEWEQVARRMGRTSGAARMLWMRALKKLAPLIERSRA